ncbi:hypothetical protein DUH56_07705 [Campylobacter coli]|nr:hypothetical protein [Campylobacter coli]
MKQDLKLFFIFNKKRKSCKIFSLKLVKVKSKLSNFFSLSKKYVWIICKLSKHKKQVFIFDNLFF